MPVTVSPMRSLTSYQTPSPMHLIFRRVWRVIVFLSGLF